MTRYGRWAEDAVQFVLDDETMNRLVFEAEALGIEVELLMVKLLDVSSRQVRWLLREELSVVPSDP